ncbi:hypothetical protein [Acidovorax kalamii]|uniref:hypothetical protein n=1 Tax=Acidovorax kalamii TaxID=2004485 RepID=UPI0020919127|nr:hypothetical protein [Acidovorax kalamii]MCO5356562.1 hypothetical protein [Acidovorax kalamii]
MSARLIAWGLAVCALIVGAKALQSHLISKGDAQGAARVQHAWDTQENARNAATARDNATRFRNAERTANEDAQREAARRARDAAAAAVVRSLRAEVARLNSRPDPYPAGDAGLAACAGEARAARELLGESSGAYQELAAEADGLRDQVTGLQSFARNVCGAGKTGGAVD